VIHKLKTKGIKIYNVDRVNRGKMGHGKNGTPLGKMGHPVKLFYISVHDSHMSLVFKMGSMNAQSMLNQQQLSFYGQNRKARCDENIGNTLYRKKCPIFTNL
jgi:hypothetical protein